MFTRKKFLYPYKEYFVLFSNRCDFMRPTKKIWALTPLLGESFLLYLTFDSPTILVNLGVELKM